MKYVIVRYEELNEDYAYLLEDQAAYVPIYADNIVLLFQDRLRQPVRGCTILEGSGDG